MMMFHGLTSEFISVLLPSFFKRIILGSNQIQGQKSKFERHTENKQKNIKKTEI